MHSDHLDVTIPGAMNGGTTLTTSREYNNVQDIQNQIPDARVWIGFHFRNSVVQGLKIGNEVADWSLGKYFGPTHS